LKEAALMLVALIVLGGVAALALVAVVALVRRPQPEPAAALAPVTVVDPALQAELRSQAARIDRLSDGLAQSGAGQEAMRTGLDQTRAMLADMRSREQERRIHEEEARASLQRLEATFLGASSRGRVGENVVWEALQMLPPDMVDTQFHVNGKVVEFCLRLPDGKRLPVDSKWTGVTELELLENAQGDDRLRIARALEKLAADRAKEVAKYLDPSLTTPFAVAAVPDAVHAVLKRAHLDAHARGVLLVPYSAALPIVMALYSLCCRLGADGADVGALVGEVSSALDGIERTLENSVERSAKMAVNAAAEIRTNLGRARGALGRARLAEEDPEPLAPLRAVD
jgi:DNA recombination protein RmuC